MELAKIESLLEKYLEANTSLAEEQILKEYFSKEDVPAHLLEYKHLFNFFSDSSLETSKRSIRLTSKTINLKWLSVAAMLIFFISIYTVYQKNETEKEEARLAYVETQKALNLISMSLNKGTGAIAQLENFNKGTEAIAQLENFNRGTEAMAHLQTFENTQKRIFNQ